REDRAARVAVRLARIEHRLLADDARPLDLAHGAVAVGDDPVPTPELDAHPALVGDRDDVREREARLVGLGLLRQVARLDADADAFGDLGGHRPLSLPGTTTRRKSHALGNGIHICLAALGPSLLRHEAAKVGRWRISFRSKARRRSSPAARAGS